MELIDLSVKTRESKGKGAARKLRAEDAIPAIVYGAKVDPLKLSVEKIVFDKIIRDNGTTGLFFNLKVDGSQEKMVMLKEVQMDPFGLKYLHIDFHEIDMDKKVSVMVPVEADGVCEGVKEGGMLQIIRRELEVLCKPKDTPESITIDISGLNIGDAVHVEDIDLGDAIEIPHEVNFTVITIVPPTTSSDGVEEEEEDELGEVAAEEAPAETEEYASGKSIPMSDSKFILVAGLGNPGKEYSQTRHNIGFMVVDALAASLSTTLDKTRFDAAYARARLRGQDLFLVKPMAYMNRSGPPIQRLASYFKISMGDIIVVHDDMDLEFGKLKVVQGRGHGGHNGIRSIIDAFGRRECIRVRVGVGHPGRGRDVTGHVLGRFTPDEQAGLDPLISDSVNACRKIIEKGVVKAMNQVNSRR